MVEGSNRPQPSSIDTEVTSNVEANEESPAVPAPTVVAVSTLSPDTVLDRRYRLRNPVTSRGPVTLWRGDDEVLARAVAVRVVEHSDPDDPDREQAGRMLLEAAVNSGRLVHPGAASTYDATVTTTDVGRISYVVSEWVDGKTLRQLASDGKMSPSQVASVVLAASRVIAAAHDRGIHHGDLHPGEVIVSSHGTVKIIDIEIGGVLCTLDGSGAPPGASGDLQREDVRGLGALLYAGLTGRWPLGGDRGLPAAPTSSDGQLRSPRQVRSSVPRDLDAVTFAALGDKRSVGPEISTAEELVEELAAIAPGDAVFDPGLLRLEGATGTQAMPAGGYGSGPATATQPSPGLPVTSEYQSVDYPSRSHATSNYGPPRRTATRTAPAGYPPAPQQPRGGAERTSAYGERPPPYGERTSAYGERPSAYGERPPPPYRESERPPARGRGNRRLLAIVAVLLVLAVGSVAAVVTTSSDNPPSPTPTTTTTAAPVAGQTLTPNRTQSFDPLGDDGGEKEGRVPGAFDGNPDTSWETSGYNDQLGGAFKAGVGLMAEFDQPVEVGQLDITVANGATSFQLLSSDTASNTIDDYNIAAERPDASGTVTVQVENAGTHRYWVIWLTKLPQVDGKFKGTIVDLTLRS